MFKKKVPVWVFIVSLLLVCLITFQVTFVLTVKRQHDAAATAGNANKQFVAQLAEKLKEIYSKEEESGGSGNEEGTDGPDLEFVAKLVAKLTEYDAEFRKNYIGEVDDDVLIDSMLRGYAEGTGDKYADYYNKDDYKAFMGEMTGESEGIGINVIYNEEYGCIEVITVFPDSPAVDAGLMPGDLIIDVGEEKTPVSELGYYPAIAKLRGKSGTEAIFTVARGKNHEERVDMKITRGPIKTVSVFSHVYDLDESVGIVRISGFDSQTPTQFFSAVEDLVAKGCDKFVFDLRYNPGGELNSIVQTLDYLVPEGPIIRIFDSEDNEVERKNSDSREFDYPMAVLVNGSTASAAELFTSTMRDYDKAVIVGTTTYGKGCMQTTIPMSDGSAFTVTYRMYKPPFSESYHGVGIVPDIEVELDESLKEKNSFKITDEEDNQLREAVKALTEDKKDN